MRNTRLEVNTKKFLNNIKKIKDYCNGKEVMPVIKANAYGTYINERLDIINNFNIVAVAIVDEGIHLRKLGYKKEIFILNQPSIEEINLIKEYDLTIGLSDTSFINECIKTNSKINCHLEIETGMNRTGIIINNLKDILEKIINSNIEIRGIYTHLSSADFDEIYTNKQIQVFKDALDTVRNYNIPNLKYIHVSASNGLINYKLDFTNLIRPGIIMYGYESFAGSSKIIEVEPIAKLKTTITFIKECDKDEKIGYSQKYTCKSKTIVATIPIGYADGLRRSMSNKGFVLVNNIKCPIIGNVCMDSCMIDVTKIENVKVGDEVIIFDNNQITLDDIAKIYDTINYEVLSTISTRVPREFTED